MTQNRIQAMSRADRRAAESYLAKENRKYPAHLVEIPRTAWPVMPANVVAVFRPREFLVQIYRDRGMTRLSVNRTQLTVGGAWSDQITWDELQRIKRECGYGDADAVEVYPADADVVNVANMRHLWIMPDGVPFAWKRNQGRSDLAEVVEAAYPGETV